MVDDKDKILKNPARQKQDNVQPYVPHYKVMGLEPELIKHTLPQSTVLITKGGVTQNNNPRTRQPSVRQPYAEIPDSQPLGNSPIPNVGNNLEQTWSSLDGEIVDDISEQDQQQYDNQSTDSTLSSDDKDLDLSSLKDDSYILLVNGSVISIGTLEEIQDFTSALVFGEHELCNGNPVPLENIIVLKKVKIKTGLFFE